MLRSSGWRIGLRLVASLVPVLPQRHPLGAVWWEQLLPQLPGRGLRGPALGWGVLPTLGRLPPGYHLHRLCEHTVVCQLNDPSRM